MLDNLPVLLLKKLVVLPYQEVRLELNIELSKKVIDLAKENYSSKLLVACPLNTLELSPLASDLPQIGVLCKIKSKLELPNGNYRVTLTGLNRVIVRQYKNFEDDVDILEASIKRIYIDKSNKSEEEAILRSLKGIVDKYMKLNPSASNSVTNTMANIDDLDMLTDIITNYMPFDINKKVKYMNEFDYIIRANNLIKDISLELEVVSIESKIDEELRLELDKEQRNYIIKEKIKKLNEELGISGNKETEVQLYKEKIEALDIGIKSKKKLLNEVNKYSYTSEANPDSSVIRNYLDTVISLPWNNFSKDETDLRKIKKVLDTSHFGLEIAKMRILEFISIKKNVDNINAPIICLVGPPGTGKTTLGISISKALNREFYKISVGGLNDASELTGHKRTYLGSSPGKIIQGIKKCGTSNPIILIDEVDKMVSDFKGDPSAVLLDILDSNQNKEFIDNYIEEPFDLSKVLFILTANDINTIPSALKDRLEIIDISSYTEIEKIDIAKKYLLPRIIKEYNTYKIRFSDEVILSIINNYTKESGIRELDRVLKKIYRYIIVNNLKIKTMTIDKMKEILGPFKYDTAYSHKNHVGSANALGVTPYGGIIISLESIFLPNNNGTGNIIMTGNVEKTIEESANVAYNYLISKAKEYGMDMKKINSSNIHINALNYAMKKDGTSGGLAFATLLLSLFLNKEIPAYTCFTGEITLHGDICKVGGIKEKIIGAYNAGFKNVFIPKENINDLIDVPNEIKNNITINCVSTFDEVFVALFKKHK